MPAVSAPAKVLVTGANGFVATWFIRYLLQAGYSVRAAVRAPSKATHIEKMFKPYGSAFEVAIVPDLTTEGAFDEAVKGVDAIAHTATPVSLVCDHPSEMIDPAVGGALGILKSAAKNGASVRRIVITSSCAAVTERRSLPGVFNEDNWNDEGVENVEKLVRNASQLDKYSASKVLAERAAWDYYNEVRNTVSWDLVTIQPSMIFGPAIQGAQNPSALPDSMKFWYNIVFKKEGWEQQIAMIASQVISLIDVRDVAEGHFRALTRDGVEGRILLAAENYAWEDFWALVEGKELPQEKFQHPAMFDCRKQERVLGIKLRGIREVTCDLVADFACRGWL